MLRGHLALSSEPLREPIPDAARLEKGPLAKEPVPEAKGGVPSGPVAGDWVKPTRTLIGRSQGEEGAALETEPVSAEGKTFVARIHEHRMEARDASGRALWSVTTGGRISGPPLVHEGVCFFGSHDGWVYGVRADDGVLLWRFRAAPYDRKYISNNQLESSWPVFGVTLHEGLLCFSAGLHPEIGGGIFVYGVEPATGSVKWKKVIRKGLVVLEGTAKRPPPVVPNRVLNDALRSEGGSLILPGLRFDPTTTDDDLRSKLEAPAPKKK
jgi:hypothetical protein